MKAIGLMSGTSVDGVDAALVEVRERSGRIKVRLNGFLTHPYPPKLRKRIIDIAEPGACGVAELADLNVRVGEVFADAALAVCDAAGLDATELDFIGSHGQTVAHLPDKGATLQIGEPSVIAAKTGAMVVADFRPADMAAGGQGAPLTPMADYHFFRSKSKTRLVVNIGGITNITLLSAGIGSTDDIVGFDTGFGNMPLNEMVRILSRGRYSYDPEGQLAEQGLIMPEWIETILDHPFFRQKPPKSAGREQFGRHFIDELFEGLEIKERTGKDYLLTNLSEAVAVSVAWSMRKFVMPVERVDEVLICGGGARNRFLMNSFMRNFHPARVITSDKAGVPADAREAMAFALLGYLTLKGRPGNVPSVTGASKPVVLGKIVNV